MQQFECAILVRKSLELAGKIKISCGNPSTTLMTKPWIRRYYLLFVSITYKLYEISHETLPRRIDPKTKATMKKMKNKLKLALSRKRSYLETVDYDKNTRIMSK